jgi:kynureninase
MRKLWNVVGGEPDANKSEALARDFRDELTQAHNQAKSEWDAIDRDLLKWAIPTLGGALASGAFSLALPVAGFAVAGIGEIIQAEMKRREFRRKVPMSVFIDLERR